MKKPNQLERQYQVFRVPKTKKKNFSKLKLKFARSIKNISLEPSFGEPRSSSAGVSKLKKNESAEMWERRNKILERRGVELFFCDCDRFCQDVVSNFATIKFAELVEKLWLVCFWGPDIWSTRQLANSTTGQPNNRPTWQQANEASDQKDTFGQQDNLSAKQMVN